MNILTIEGGGIKGIVALSIIKKIELHYQKPVTDLYDLIIGTSTGGIIACGYGSGYNTEDMMKLYLDNANKIFSRNLLWKIKSGYGVFDAKYDSNKLFEILMDYFGGKYLTESKVRIITTAYNTIKNDVFLFDSKDKSNYTMVDAAMATSAAPTLFPPYKYDNQNQFIDGGIYAGNPDIIAYGELIKDLYNVDDKGHSVTSIGTGIYPYKPYDTNGWGIKEWLIKDNQKPLLDMIFAGQRQVNNYVMNKSLDSYYKHYNIILKDKVAMDESNPDKLMELVYYCNNYKLEI